MLGANQSVIDYKRVASRGFLGLEFLSTVGEKRLDTANRRALFAVSRMHSLGDLWEIGLIRRHNESSTVHPGSLGLTASARARVRTEKWSGRSSFHRSMFRSVYFQTIATSRWMSQRRNLWRLSRKSLSVDSHRPRRTARSLIARKVDEIAIFWRESSRIQGQSRILVKRHVDQLDISLNIRTHAKCTLNALTLNCE